MAESDTPGCAGRGERSQSLEASGAGPHQHGGKARKRELEATQEATGGVAACHPTVTPPRVGHRFCQPKALGSESVTLLHAPSPGEADGKTSGGRGLVRASWGGGEVPWGSWQVQQAGPVRVQPSGSVLLKALPVFGLNNF